MEESPRKLRKVMCVAMAMVRAQTHAIWVEYGIYRGISLVLSCVCACLRYGEHVMRISSAIQSHGDECCADAV